MQFTALNTVPSLEGKPREIRVLFAETANEALAKGRTEDEAIFQGLAIVKQKEQKGVVKSIKPSAPMHLQAILNIRNAPQTLPEPLGEALIEKSTKDSLASGKEVIGAEFDAKGRLVLKFKDGKTLISNVAPITAVETSVIVVGGNSISGADEVIEGLTELEYTGQDLVRVDMPDGSYKELTYAGGILVQVDHIQATQTVRKTLNYTLGVLTSVLTEML